MVKIKIEQGWLEGEQLDLSLKEGKYYSFKGIPFAAPPVGTLRFKAPQPPLPWDGIRKATEHGPICPQVDIITNEYKPGNEDCLYLNVYSPELSPQNLLPVMVFIHGGGYKSGSGNDDEYGADFLINYGVVLVTINYRLDALGFLCLDSPDVPGNAGMKDQVAALRWVQSNINKFGGDPQNVTIFGESAGGASCFLHLLSPMSRNLFRRAIPMSGSPLCEWSFSFEPRRRAFKLGKLLGFETENSDELLTFLQSVPVEKLVNTKPFLLSYEEHVGSILKFYAFNPAIEKDFGGTHFITQDPEEIMRNGTFNPADVMIGHTSDEMLLTIKQLHDRLLDNYNKYSETFIPRPFFLKKLPATALELSERIKKRFMGNKPVDKSSTRELINCLNETSIVYGVRKAAKLLPDNINFKKFFYVFSCFSSRNIYGKVGLEHGFTGTAHKDDLMYLFQTELVQFHSKNKESAEYKMIDQTCTLFSNFAKYGNPTPDSKLGVVWPEYNRSNEQYLDIGETLVVGSMEPTIMEFWENIENS